MSYDEKKKNKKIRFFWNIFVTDKNFRNLEMNLILAQNVVYL